MREPDISVCGSMWVEEPEAHWSVRGSPQSAATLANFFNAGTQTSMASSFRFFERG